tara:strand:- start:776 stop:1066 length:291 start_codon:yes stop_codon:yes gene_type:complete
MGVGLLRRALRIELLHEDIELLRCVPGSVRKIRLSPLDNSPKTVLDRIRSGSGSFEKCDGSGYGWGDRVQKFSNHRTTRSALEAGESLYHSMGFWL